MTRSIPKVVELTTLLENIHRAVNIGLVNEMKIVADWMGIDIHEVIDAAATKPFVLVPYRLAPASAAYITDLSLLPDLEGARIRHQHPPH